MALAEALTRATPRNNDSATLERFRVALRERMVDGEEDWKWCCLDVDYHECEALNAAASAAGLKMQFPWKTHMRLSAHRVIFSLGYGAPYFEHYPLKDGRWLVCRLNGEDMDKVIASAENGNPLGLTIEEAVPNA